MTDERVSVAPDQMPFFIVPPGETDLLFLAVAGALVLVVLGFGALYFTVQAWPDRLAKGVGKAQLQIVGILGLLSLLTLNNALWVAALLLAAIRIPDIVTPLRDIARALGNSSRPGDASAATDGPPEVAAEPATAASPAQPEPASPAAAGNRQD